MIRSTLHLLSRVVLVCTALCWSVFAQSDRGSITGRVMDPSGASVAGVAVKVTNVNTGATFDATTNDDGRFVVLSRLNGGSEVEDLILQIPRQ